MTVFNHLEEGTGLQLDFGKLQQIGQSGLQVIPAVAQDIDSGEILMLGYANRQALDYALAHKVATFWSTSRNELWVKGKSSGETLLLEEVRVNCEQNSLLYRVRLAKTGACHTRDQSGQPRRSCYYRRIGPTGLEFV